MHLRLALLSEYSWIVEEIDDKLTSLTSQLQQLHVDNLTGGKLLLHTISVNLDIPSSFNPVFSKDSMSCAPQIFSSCFCLRSSSFDVLTAPQQDVISQSLSEQVVPVVFDLPPSQ